MKPFIFTERNGIHIIDLQQTANSLENVYKLVRNTVAQGGSILFVGTKRQAQDIIKKNATEVGMPYVIGRWLGGTLTNWQTIRERIHELERLEGMRDRGEFELRIKKEALGMMRQIERLESRLGGIREMDELPDLLFAIDVFREEIPIHEANLLKIPVIAMVDTNCNPKQVDYVIPSNDDAIRAIQLIVGTIANAVKEGQAMRKDSDIEMEILEAQAQLPREMQRELSDEELLGDSTLAKLKESEAAAEIAEEKADVEEEAEVQEEVAAVEDAAAEKIAAAEDAVAEEETKEDEA